MQNRTPKMNATPRQRPPSTSQRLQQLVDEEDKMLEGYRTLQSRGTVTGGPVQNTASLTPAPGALTTAAPEPWYHPLVQHILGWLGISTPGAQKAAAKQFTAGAAYLANGGKQRAADVNSVIDAAGGK